MKKSKWNTMMFRMTIYYVALLVIVFIMIIASLNIIQRESRVSAAFTTLSAPYTKIYSDLDRLRGLNSGILGIDEKAEELKESNELLEDVQAQAAQLVELLNADGDYNRSSIDMENTLTNYANLYADVQRNHINMNYSGMNDTIAELDRTEKWIRSYLADTGTAIAERQEKMRRGTSNVLHNYYNAMMVLGGIMFILCVVELAMCTRKLVRPIEVLCKNVESFRLSDSLEALKEKGVPCAPGSTREVRTLATAIYSMQNTVLDQYTGEKHNQWLKEKLDHEALRNAEIEKQLQETQLKALQAQINPHFLFNTLNMIGQMSYLEGAQKTGELLETFSDFFRYTVESFETNVTLEKELQNTKGYIALQKERFEDRIAYEIYSDSGIESICVPCLIIQPLVENAVSHGLRMVTEKGLVQIFVRALSDSGFEISVSDNGCGMSERDLAALIHRTEQPEFDNASEHHSIGVSNVISRMRISFGARFSYSIESEPDKGFNILLRVEGGEMV